MVIDVSLHPTDVKENHPCYVIILLETGMAKSVLACGPQVAPLAWGPGGSPPPWIRHWQFQGVYTFIVASKKMLKGVRTNRNPKNPGIDFYSGFRKTSQWGGGVQIEILKKSRYRLL